MPSGSPRRLDSWKEIADYLGRSVRTAVRWADERGLPVHHVPGGKRQAVFGFTNEVDDWLLSTENLNEPDAVSGKLPQSETDVLDPSSDMSEQPWPSSADSPELDMSFDSLSEIVTAQPSSHRKSWVLGGAFAVLCSVATVFLFSLRSSHAGPAASTRVVRLAVLPVQNLTGDPAREVLADGLTQELIAHLGGLNPREMQVIAQTSAISYKGSDKNLSQIAGELHVDYLLQSSMRGNLNQLKFSTQLVRVRDESARWMHDYDASTNDISLLESDVGLGIAKEVGLRDSSDVSNPDPNLSIRPESRMDYLQGRYFWSLRSKESLDHALESFHRAIDEDPKNARAYSGLADTYNVMVFYGYWASAAGIAKAQEAAHRALDLDPSLAEAHTSLAYVNFMWTWDWNSAEREFRRALELDANYVPAHHWYALYLASMGRHAEAEREIHFALNLDPVSSAVQSAAGYVHFWARDYDAAILECQSVLKRNPGFGVAHTVLGMSYEGKGQYAQAISEFRTVDEAAGGHVPYYKGPLGHAYALAGDLKNARKTLAELDAMALQGSYASQTAKALIYLGLGDKQNALDSLERARDQNDASLIWLSVDSRFDPLRSDPRFQQLLRSQGRIS